MTGLSLFCAHRRGIRTSRRPSLGVVHQKTVSHDWTLLSKPKIERDRLISVIISVPRQTNMAGRKKWLIYRESSSAEDESFFSRLWLSFFSFDLANSSQWYNFNNLSCQKKKEVYNRDRDLKKRGTLLVAASKIDCGYVSYTLSQRVKDM